MPADRPFRYLLTPGPLTTSRTVKEAMLEDWGSWDDDFKDLTADVRTRILRAAGVDDAFTCVPIQGSGTFAVEAALLTLVGREGKVLVLVNGAYGRRIAETCRRAGLSHSVLESAETEAPDAAGVAHALDSDPAITHVAIVQCETSTGISNRVEEIAPIAAARGRRLIVDAMSAFGVLRLDPMTCPFDALVASANKCLEGVPGAGFVVVRTAALMAAEGRCPSLSLDLHDQWAYMERTRQWRYTPPTHVMAALHRALIEYEAEGGQPARLARYAENRRTLVAEMAAIGLRPLLPAENQSPIIVTFLAPDHPAYDFGRLYAGVKDRGFVIYPGKLTVAETFRIGCIGQVDAGVMRGVVKAVAAALTDMGVRG